MHGVLVGDMVLMVAQWKEAQPWRYEKPSSRTLKLMISLWYHHIIDARWLVAISQRRSSKAMTPSVYVNVHWNVLPWTQILFCLWNVWRWRDKRINWETEREFESKSMIAVKKFICHVKYEKRKHTSINSYWQSNLERDLKYSPTNDLIVNC